MLPFEATAGFVETSDRPTGLVELYQFANRGFFDDFVPSDSFDHAVRGAEQAMHAIWMLLAVSVGGQPSVDFDTQVTPIFSKAGCNSAACHGAAAGRGGFKLSLFGGDPAADHEAIVRQLEGRRINLARPEDSLLLAKPTGMLDHEGGVRLDEEGPQVATLLRWLKAGARRSGKRQLITLEVQPPRATIERTPATVSLKVWATFRQGAQNVREDVTSLAVFDTGDESALTVRPDGTARILRPGRHLAVVRFLSRVLTVQFTAPLPGPPLTAKRLQRENWIDDLVNRSLAELRIPPSPPAKDAALLRRLTLDLTGRLPTPEVAREYSKDRAADRYTRMVDRLLNSEAFVDYWTFKLGLLLRIKPQPQDTQGVAAFRNWIQQQLRERKSYASMVRAMLTAEGDSHQVGPANFYRIVRGPREQAEYASEALMGVRLRCANCHNHPLDQWKQEDYHGLAAVFANVEQNRVIRVLSRGEVTNPKTGEPALKRIPGHRDLKGGEDARRSLADWLTGSDNPYFARALVNRLWKALLGRGLVEPTDDLRATNPATHPELLARLSAEFVKDGFRIRPTLRRIVRSATYKRSKKTLPRNAADQRFYSHALRRPLEPEVLADAIVDVTGSPEKYGDQPAGVRAVALANPLAKSRTLDVLGRCGREDSCEAPAGASGGLSTRLHLLNGPLLNAKIVAPQGRLRRLLATRKSAAEVVEQFYLAALSRPPNAAERKYWREQLQGSREQQREVLEDFVWSLLSSRTFGEK